MTDLFDANNTDPMDVDPNVDYLAELVGDGKKFKDIKELAKGKAASDSYIKTMESRMDELRNDYLKLKADAEARANLQELIDQMKLPQNNNNGNTPQQPKLEDKPVYDPAEIEKMVQANIQKNETAKKQTENFNYVMGKIKESYGPNYIDALKSQTETLNLDTAFVNDLARNHPQVLLKTLGLDQPKQTEQYQAPLRNTFRSDNFSQKGPQKRTWSYYQELKKTNPNLYSDPKITVQMHKDFEELGEAFKDGDYNSI